MRRTNYEMVSAYVENADLRGRSYSVVARDQILYSYGEHYPLMVPNETGHFLINTDGYSPTTAHHISMARRQAGEQGIHVPFSRLPLDIEEMKQSRVLDHDDDYTVLHAPDLRAEDRSERTRDRYFLMGPDDTYKVKVRQREWQRPWVAELRGPAETIEEALESLKPRPVREAEEGGREVIRQGDFFFVHRLRRRPKLSWYLTETGVPHYLANSHAVRRAIKARIDSETITLVRGSVKHDEHKAIFLKHWYQPYRSTARRLPGRLGPYFD